MGDLLLRAKDKPGQLTYGTFGVGTSGHLNVELLQQMAGIKLQPVHYRGATPAFNDILGGHIDLMFINPSSTAGAIADGKVVLLAVSSKRRLPKFPQAPTLSESGVPGYEAGSWFGLFAPAKTPPEIVQTLNSAVAKIYADATFVETFLSPNMLEPITSAPEEFHTFVKAEAEKWGALVRLLGLKAE